MANERQIEVPDVGGFHFPFSGTLHEEGEKEYPIPSGGTISEDQAPVAAGFVPYPNPRYAMHGGMQTMSGGV